MYYPGMLSNILQLDDSPLSSDWEDFDALQSDIKAFAQSHPSHSFVCADDPGTSTHGSPTRVPRIGWHAFITAPPFAPGDFDEEPKFWTIKVGKLKSYTANDENLSLSLKSAAGRVAHLTAMTGK